MLNSDSIDTKNWKVIFVALFTASILAAPGSGNAGAVGGTTTGNNIVPSLVPSRNSGVAPLSIFFDASATTDTGVSRPFHDLEYTWNFGDTNAGTWAYGASPGSSKNAATGPVASHVFESSGTYTVSLTVFDGTNSKTIQTRITVKDPDAVFTGTNTICVGAERVPASGAIGCPAHALVVKQKDFATAVNTYAHTGKRLLFRRGDTFTAPASGVIDKTGPGIVGAFGTGAPPTVLRTSAYPILVVSDRRTPAIKDWRIMDLDFDGQSDIKEDNAGITAGGGINQVLILRMNMRNMHRGVAAGPWGLDYLNTTAQSGHTIFEEWAIIDSTITGIPGCNSQDNYICDWRVYLAGKKISIQGNLLDNQDTGGSHVIRSEYMSKGIISNNNIARAGVFQMAIKLHAWTWNAAGVANPGGVGTYSEQVVISDNKIIGGINPWTISLGPQNGTSDERVRDIIVERNWFTAGSGTQLHMHINSSETTIRNNICDLSGATYHTCVGVVRWGTTPDNVRVYNNTFYSGSSGDFYGVSIDAFSTNVTLKNNLGSAPNATNTPVMYSGTGASGFSQSNNLLNNKASALFVSAKPSAPADFRLKALPNQARDTGLSTVPVFSDFFLLRRPQGKTTDIGAIEAP